MTNGVAYINGIRVPFNGTTKTLPASRNTYAYLNPDGSVQYLDTALGAAEPTAPSGTLLITGISTNATAVTANTSYNRGITGAEAIDYASFYGLNGLPAAQTGLPFITKTLNIGYGMTARLVREGNVVSLSVNTVTSQGVPSLDIQNLTETIPLGFRPRATTDAQMFGGAVIGGSGTRMGWTVNSAGAMQFSNTTATSGSMRVYASAAWITRDPFPAS